MAFIRFQILVRDTEGNILSVSIRLRTTCNFDSKLEQLVQVGQSWVKLILVGLFCPLV